MELRTREEALTQIRRIMNTFDIPSVEDRLRAILGTENCYLQMEDGVFHLVDPSNDKTIVMSSTLPGLFQAFEEKL